MNISSRYCVQLYQNILSRHCVEHYKNFISGNNYTFPSRIFTSATCQKNNITIPWRHAACTDNDGSEKHSCFLIIGQRLSFYFSVNRDSWYPCWHWKDFTTFECSHWMLWHWWPWISDGHKIFLADGEGNDVDVIALFDKKTDVESWSLRITLSDHCWWRQEWQCWCFLAGKKTNGNSWPLRSTSGQYIWFITRHTSTLTYFKDQIRVIHLV